MLTMAWRLLVSVCFVILGTSSVNAQSTIDRSPTSFIWSPDGNYLISSHWSELVFWSTNGQVEHIETVVENVSGDSLVIRSLAIDPSSRYLAIGGVPSGLPIGVIFIMDLQSKEIIAVLQNESYIHDVHWSPDGDYLIASSPNLHGLPGEDAVIFWDTNTYTEIIRINGEAIEGISSTALDPDRTRVATISSLRPYIEIWNTDNGNLITSIESPANPYRIDWSADGQFIAVASADPDVEISNDLLTIWDTTTWVIVRTIQLEIGFYEIQWNPVFSSIAIQSGPEILIYDIQGNLSHTINGGRFTWSPDGTQIVTGDRANESQIIFHPVLER